MNNLKKLNDELKSSNIEHFKLKKYQQDLEQNKPLVDEMVKIKNKSLPFDGNYNVTLSDGHGTINVSITPDTFNVYSMTYISPKLKTVSWDNLQKLDEFNELGQELSKAIEKVVKK